MPQPLPRMTRQLSSKRRALRTALTCLAGTAVLLAAPSAGAAAAAPVATVIEQRPDGVVIRLEAPAVEWRGGNRYIYPVIPGFGTLSETRTARRSRSGSSMSRSLPGRGRASRFSSSSRRPPLPGRSVPCRPGSPSSPGTPSLVPFGTEDPTVYAADDLYPADKPVRLGEIGALREQPFVELVFTPVLHSPGRGRSVVYRSVTVRVDFGMVAPVSATFRG